MLFGMALAAISWIALVYLKEPTGSIRRAALATVRCTIIALVVGLLCEPVLVLQRNRVEPSHVALVVDTSLSMGARDTYQNIALARAVAKGGRLEDPSELHNYSRLELVQRALLADDAAEKQRGSSLSVLLARNGVELLTFDNVVKTQGFFRTTEPESLSSLADGLASLQASGRATDVPGAILHILQKNQGRRLAAIILATDGRSTTDWKAGSTRSLKDTIDLAVGRQVPVFPIRIGEPRRPRDLEVVSVKAPDSVFVHDMLAVEAVISATALTGPTTVRVQLVDERTGLVVDAREMVLDPQSIDNPQSAISNPVELHTKPTWTGPTRYRIEVAPLTGESILDNNHRVVDVRIVDDHLRVLYVESYPRYEYRYLKNALLREESVSLSVLLLQADQRFVQEGTEPIRRFPETLEELNRFDVVLFGDVDPRSGWLSDVQVRMLLDFVRNHGGGFGLIAGVQAAPQRFLGTALESLIPIRIDPALSGFYEGPLESGFSMRLTEDGRRGGIFHVAGQTGKDERLIIEPASLPVEALPQLYWFARSLGPKSGATVLVEHSTLRTVTGPMPLVVLGRYGAGKIFFQATDDTWRWRRHTGELLHDTYWVRVVRELMPEVRTARDRRYAIGTDRRVYEYGAAVQAQLEFFDAQLLGEQGDDIQIEMGSPNSDGASPRRAQRFTVRRFDPESNRFEGVFVPPRPGDYLLTAPDLPPRPGERATSATIRVQSPDLESRRPEADHEVLERIASTTGGRVLDLDQLETAFATIRDRSVQIPDDVTEPLWDSRLALLLFVSLISIEWVLRKICGLL